MNTFGSGCTSAVKATPPRSLSDGSRNDAYPPGVVSAIVVTGPPSRVLLLQTSSKLSSTRKPMNAARPPAFSDGSSTGETAPVLSAIVLNVPSGLERKIPLTDVALRPLLNATWPLSLSDVRDERLLKLNPSGVGV